MPCSRTSTSTPWRASHQPALRPVTPPPTMTTEAPALVTLDLPPRRPLAGDAEPGLPVLAHGRGLALVLQHGERQRAERRAPGREREGGVVGLAGERQDG